MYKAGAQICWPEGRNCNLKGVLDMPKINKKKMQKIHQLQSKPFLKYMIQD